MENITATFINVIYSDHVMAFHKFKINEIYKKRLFRFYYQMKKELKKDLSI